MKEKHSPETKRRLDQLEETVGNSVRKAKDIDELREKIALQRETEIQLC